MNEPLNAPKVTSFSDLEMKIIQWAEARKIIPRSTPLAQATKTAEESVELVTACAKLKLLNDLERIEPGVGGWNSFRTYRASVIAELKDAIGDVLVTVINAAALADVSTLECLALAYDEIKDRKGELMPNGIFVKHVDAPAPQAAA